MINLKDGQYRTWPKWSPATEANVRVVVVENGRVRVNQFCFTQEDFLSVNKLVPATLQ